VKRGWVDNMAALEELALNDPDSLLTPGEVSDIMRVNPKTVTRWGREALIPSVKTPGGHRRFKASEVLLAMGVFK